MSSSSGVRGGTFTVGSAERARILDDSLIQIVIHHRQNASESITNFCPLLTVAFRIKFSYLSDLMQLFQAVIYFLW